MGTGPVVGCTGVIHDEIDCIRARVPDPQKCKACATAVSQSLRALVRLWQIRAKRLRLQAGHLEHNAVKLDEEIEWQFPQLGAQDQQPSLYDALHEQEEM